MNLEILPGFDITFNSSSMFKLKTSLYWLKQAPRTWFDGFTKAVKQFGYTQCQADHTMFIKHLEAGRRAILIVYVDDIILTGYHHKELLRLRNFLVK